LRISVRFLKGWTFLLLVVVIFGKLTYDSDTLLVGDSEDFTGECLTVT
jgi:hypothetical protein